MFSEKELEQVLYFKIDEILNNDSLKKYIIKFNKDGYLVIENFISHEKCEELIKECNNITDGYTLEDIKKLSVFEGNVGSEQAQVINFKDYL